MIGREDNKERSSSMHRKLTVNPIPLKTTQLPFTSYTLLPITLKGPVPSGAANVDAASKAAVHNSLAIVYVVVRTFDHTPSVRRSCS